MFHHYISNTGVFTSLLRPEDDHLWSTHHISHVHIHVHKCSTPNGETNLSQMSPYLRAVFVLPPGLLVLFWVKLVVGEFQAMVLGFYFLLFSQMTSVALSSRYLDTPNVFQSFSKKQHMSQFHQSEATKNIYEKSTKDLTLECVHLFLSVSSWSPQSHFVSDWRMKKSQWWIFYLLVWLKR